MENRVIKANEYQCAMCGEVYEKGQTEEEAIAECMDNFGCHPSEVECDVVCDDCYNKHIVPSFS